MFTIICVYLVKVLLFWLKKLRNVKIIDKVYLLFNYKIFIRLGISLYLPIFLSILLQINDLEYRSPASIIQYAGLALSLIFCSFIFLTPIILLTLQYFNKHIDDSRFEEFW